MTRRSGTINKALAYTPMDADAYLGDSLSGLLVDKTNVVRIKVCVLCGMIPYAYDTYDPRQIKLVYSELGNLSNTAL